MILQILVSLKLHPYDFYITGFYFLKQIIVFREIIGYEIIYFVKRAYLAHGLSAYFAVVRHDNNPVAVFDHDLFAFHCKFVVV